MEKNFEKLSIEEMSLVSGGREISVGCGVALAGYCVAAMLAVAIGGPLGFAFFQAGLVAGGAGIITSCA